MNIIIKSNSNEVLSSIYLADDYLENCLEQMAESECGVGLLIKQISSLYPVIDFIIAKKEIQIPYNQLIPISDHIKSILQQKIDQYTPTGKGKTYVILGKEIIRNEIRMNSPDKCIFKLYKNYNFLQKCISQKTDLLIYRE